MADCGKCTPFEMTVECTTSLCPSGTGGGHCEPTGWNMYDLNNPEHNLFESTLCEVTDISGFPIEYRLLLPKEDWLWGEDPNSKLSYPSFTKAIYTPETETNLLDMFGLTADDTLQYISVPKAIFNRDLTMLHTDTMGPSAFIRPHVGDVIKTIWNNKNYEIVNISEEDNIFLAKKFVWDLIVRPFRFSEQSSEHREVHTGLPDDPFETIVPGPDGDVIQNNYATEMFGDNEDIDRESDEIYNHEDDDEIQGDIDPDKAAFGR
jgi:hypothetical protein